MAVTSAVALASAAARAAFSAAAFSAAAFSAAAFSAAAAASFASAADSAPADAAAKGAPSALRILEKGTGFAKPIDCGFAPFPKGIDCKAKVGPMMYDGMSVFIAASTDEIELSDAVAAARRERRERRETRNPLREETEAMFGDESDATMRRRAMSSLGYDDFGGAGGDDDDYDPAAEADDEDFAHQFDMVGRQHWKYIAFYVVSTALALAAVLTTPGLRRLHQLPRRPRAPPFRQHHLLRGRLRLRRSRLGLGLGLGSGLG